MAFSTYSLNTDTSSKQLQTALAFLGNFLAAVMNEVGLKNICCPFGLQKPWKKIMCWEDYQSQSSCFLGVPVMPTSRIQI